MIATIDPFYAAVFVALVSPLGAYIMAARRMSGKIGTSDAAQLWAESKAIRDWSKERLEDADKEINMLRKRLDRVWTRLRDVEEQNRDLTRRLNDAQRALAECREGRQT